MILWTLISIVVFGILLLVLFQLRKGKLSAKDKAYVLSRWEAVEALSAAGDSRAVLEADKLLDWVLAKKGFEGTMAEKLKTAGGIFSDLDSVWTAHKLRNRMAHELEEKISDRELQHAVKSFRRALRDLGI